MRPPITRLAFAFAFAALLAVLAAPQAFAIVPDRDLYPAPSAAPSSTSTSVDPLGHVKPGYVRYGGVWVKVGSGGGTMPAIRPAPRPSRHDRHGTGSAAPAAFPWSDVGLGAGAALAGALGLGLAASAARRTVGPARAA